LSASSRTLRRPDDPQTDLPLQRANHPCGIGRKIRYARWLKDGRYIELNEIFPVKVGLHRVSSGPIVLVGEHLHPLFVNQVSVLEVF
jgi:hypothetical protein